MAIHKHIIVICVLILLLYICTYNSSEMFVPVDALTNYKQYKNNILFLEKVVNFLEQHNITYWAIGGTLLGAIRDKGMIPWDDDSDISVPLDQIQLIEKKLDELKQLGIGWCPAFFGYKFYDVNGVNTGYDYNYPFVDVFVVVEYNDKWIYLKEKARTIWPNEFVYSHELFPLKKYKYEHYEITSMSDPISFLDRAYNGWKIKAYKTYDHLQEKQIKKIEFAINYDRHKKPYLWVYWDNINTSKTPDLIEMCYETIKNNCDNSFEIVKLNNDNIKKYIPELDEHWNFVEKLKIAHKVDLYRIMLLYKYGGLYIDADTIVLKDPIEIMDKLDRNDYIGFGCTGSKCKNGYKKPSNGIMAARPNSHLLGYVLMNILKKIKTVNSEKYNFNYFDLGKKVIWEEISNIDGYDYYHYDNKYDGTRDKYGSWVTTKKIFSDEHINYEDPNDMLFFTLYNSELNSTLKMMSREEILNKNWNVSKYLKKGLNIH